MTDLEKEIYNATRKIKASPVFKGSTQENVSTAIAIAAAEVAKKWIEKAFEEAFASGLQYGKYKEGLILAGQIKKNWLKENGVI